MATVEQCEQALRQLADRLAENETSRRKIGSDRTLACVIRDLDVVFAGRLQDGQLVDVGRTTTDHAHVRLAMTSDDLIALVNGQLKMGPAWASGRVKIDAGVRDLLRLRALF